MESERGPTDEGLVYVPTSAFPGPHTYTDLGNFVVDGETFAARRRNEDGSFHYDWISEPNAGYGFSTFSGPRPKSHEMHIVEIRNFLAAIDPATGYL
ncbi:MAG: hypothetical protein ACOH19_11450 [Rhodoglobus sp.]